MHPIRTSLLALVPFLVVPSLGSAQDRPSMPPGPTAPVPMQSRVRVTTEAQPASPYVGRFRAWDGAAFVLEQADRSRLTVELSEVGRLELSEGRHGHGLAGGLIGAGLGIGVTTLIFATEDFDGENAGAFIYASVILGGAGGTFGALIGSQVKTDTWQEVPLDLYRPGVPATLGGHR